MSNIVNNFIDFYKKKQFSPAERIGKLLAAELKRNNHFYFFSPDETTSNKFQAIYEVEKRAWNLPKEAWDLPESKNGHIVEMLSENVLFSVMTGHLTNGEPAIMGSYEAFYTVITSQILQQIKFIKQCNESDWREKMPAVNLLSTSTCWRQDHNGFTHQSPALISTLLSVPSNLANCLFPVDDQAAEEIFRFMMKSKNVVNLTTFNKTPAPRFLTKEQVKEQSENHGVVILDQYSDRNPDIIFAAVGDLMTREVVEATKILKEDIPDLDIRVVNISALSYRGIGTVDDKLSKGAFKQIFTADKPIIANFHGYPETLENILENYTDRGRLRVHGYIEEGSTTTPFEMLRRNCASRYDIAIDVSKLLYRDDLTKKYLGILAKNHKNATEFGEDVIK